MTPRRPKMRPRSLPESKNASQEAQNEHQDAGKQLVPPRGNRAYRKTACTTAGSPHVPENSLHHRRATARTGKQLAPPRGHRTYRKTACTNAGPPQAQEPSWRSVETHVFPDSAFRSLSRQVWAKGGGLLGPKMAKFSLLFQALEQLKPRNLRGFALARPRKIT